MTHSLGCITVQKRLTEPGRHFTTLNCFSQGHFVRGPKKQPWEELPSYLGRAWKGPKHTELLSLGIRVPTLQARDPLGAHHAGRCSSLRFYGGFIVHMCTSPTTGNQLDLQPLFPAQRQVAGAVSSNPLALWPLVPLAKAPHPMDIFRLSKHHFISINSSVLESVC